MKSGAVSKSKNKIISIVVTISIVALNLVFITPAKAAISSGALISMANSARVSTGVHTLKYNSFLASSANAKARDMLKYDYFAHTSPSGKTPWSFIKGAGYFYIYAGENLAIDFSTSSAVHNAWMASATHRSNILDKDFTEIGIAALTGEYKGKTTTVVVQHFGSRANTNRPSYNQSGENDTLGQENIQNNTGEELKEKPKEKPKTRKIKLPLADSNELEIEENDSVEIIWYTSPILFLIKTLS